MKKRLLAVFLALALCVGLTVPAFAAGTKKVVEDQAHGVKITMNGFLRVETRRYNCGVWYNTFEERLGGSTPEFTIYVVADNSTVTVEALPGRKYADPSFVEATKDLKDRPGITSEDPGYAVYKAFSENKSQYAYELRYAFDWDPEGPWFQDAVMPPWPLEKAVTYTVSPSSDDYFSLSASYDVFWLCESDYNKLVPATVQASSWARADVAQAYNAGIMHFSPYILDCTQGMTRADFAAVTVWLYAAAMGKSSWELDVEKDHPFTDATWEDTMLDEEIGMAYHLGFVKGSNSAGTQFSPQATLTRQEAAVMLGRVFTKLGGTIPAVS
ncbi:MAG: hypothetical protein K2P18_06105, partial [Oscillospiraceae bacterium]|nr:hypothetical protein [Oscillospiraceae bacterium]